ncbi:MAG: response regulator transcription factor [Polyangiaceae bacterium]
MVIVVIGGGSQDEQRLARLVAETGLHVECRRAESQDVPASALPSQDVAGASLWAEPEPELGPQALVFEAVAEPEVAALALRAVRKDPYFDDAIAIVAVTVDHVARIDAASGFDDFVLHPYTLEEINGRLRALSWRRHELDAEGRRALEGVVIDKAGQEVSLYGQSVPLTAKEFALLAYLCERRGKVLSREHLLARVWGMQYEGGARTVDVHVRRLRRKLGAALTIETVRGNGYKLRRRRVTDGPLPKVSSSLPRALSASYAE